MELAFREPIRNESGDIRFPAGVFFEWPKATFQQVAQNLGKKLEEITVTKAEAGKVFTASAVVTSPKAEKPEVRIKARQRQRLKEKI